MTEDIEQQKRDALRLIADTNMAVSKAKNDLFAIQRDETTYLEEREKKAIARIQAVLDDSKDILDQAHGNYSAVKELCRDISELCSFLSEASGKFSDLLKVFEERNEAWDRDVEQTRAELAEISRKQALLATEQENEKKNIARDKAKILSDLKVIDSRQQQIKVALEVLKKKEKNNG